MTDADIILQRDENIALLLIHNPRLRNALSQALLLRLRDRMGELGGDPGVGAIIIGSDVEGAFASGGNISELRDLEGSRGGLRFAQLAQATFKAVQDCPKPVLAAIHGVCLGAGLELAMSADLRIAADNAVLASPQVGLGIMPGLGGGQRLIRLCGLEHARRQILTGDRFTASEAEALGLVEQVVPAAELWNRAREIAKRLATRSMVAMDLAKKALNYSSQARLEAGCALEAALFGLASAAANSPDSVSVSGDESSCG